MRKILVAVVDDEPLARMRLQRLLAHFEDVELVLCVSDSGALMQAITAQPVDLLFIDIEMPELDGFSAFSRLPEPRPLLVFVTAHADYASRAFDVRAVDYLLKPVTLDRIGESLQRVRLARAAQAALASAALPTVRYAESLALPMGRRTELVDTQSIDYLQAQANYVSVFVGEREFVLRSTLGALIEQLDPAQFLRIHRSCLVRLGAVQAVTGLSSGRYQLRLHSGKIVLAGRSARQQLRLYLGL